MSIDYPRTDATLVISDLGLLRQHIHDTIIGCDDVCGFQRGRAASTGDESLGIGSNDSNLLEVLRVQWQDAALVLKEDDGVSADLAHQGAIDIVLVRPLLFAITIDDLKANTTMTSVT